MHGACECAGVLQVLGWGWSWSWGGQSAWLGTPGGAEVLLKPSCPESHGLRDSPSPLQEDSRRDHFPSPILSYSCCGLRAGHNNWGLVYREYEPGVSCAVLALSVISFFWGEAGAREHVSTMWMLRHVLGIPSDDSDVCGLIWWCVCTLGVPRRYFGMRMVPGFCGLMRFVWFCPVAVIFFLNIRWNIGGSGVPPVYTIPVGVFPLVGSRGVSPLGFVWGSLDSVGIRRLELHFPFSLNLLGSTSMIQGGCRLPALLSRSSGL